MGYKEFLVWFVRLFNQLVLQQENKNLKQVLRCEHEHLKCVAKYRAFCWVPDAEYQLYQKRAEEDVHAAESDENPYEESELALPTTAYLLYLPLVEAFKYGAVGPQ